MLLLLSSLSFLSIYRSIGGWVEWLVVCLFVSLFVHLLFLNRKMKARTGFVQSKRQSEHRSHPDSHQAGADSVSNRTHLIRWVMHHVGYSVTQSASQSVELLINRASNQSISRPIDRSNDPSINQSINLQLENR